MYIYVHKVHIKKYSVYTTVCIYIHIDYRCCLYIFVVTIDDGHHDAFHSNSEWLHHYQI